MKYVFIINGTFKSRCIKRVEEFIQNGYDVKVYGFSWDSEIPNKPKNFDIEIIGHEELRFSYLKRLFVIVKALKKLYNDYKGQDVVFYYFFLDIALGALIARINQPKYIYEESDIPYLGISNKLVKKILTIADRRIIKNSFVTVMTSEGFVDFHFNGIKPSNVIIVPNRVNPLIKNYPFVHKVFRKDNLSIGFVGGFRYPSIINFTKVFISNFPNYTFHVFGDIDPGFQKECDEMVEKYSNIHFHGVFKNPQDLPGIYETIDLVLAAYDTRSPNVLYAEPNKLYEAVYFQTPIIVSSGTFLSKKSR